MGDKSIKNTEKKKKKAGAVSSAPSSFQRPVVQQPELIKKVKKVK